MTTPRGTDQSKCARCGHCAYRHGTDGCKTKMLSLDGEPRSPCPCKAFVPYGKREAREKRKRAIDAEVRYNRWPQACRNTTSNGTGMFS